jgi:Uma2 family endonuclease
MSVQEQRTTVSEFEDFIVKNANRRFELINGEIVEVSPTQRHAYIVGLLMGQLYNYLQQNPVGWGLPEARYRLPDDDMYSLIPDLSFVRKIEGRELVDEGAAPYMPEFVVEVKSPDDSFIEMREKALYYIKHGTQLVWLVFPAKQQVEVHTPESVQTYGIADTLNAGAVLPGFTVAVKDLFK